MVALALTFIFISFGYTVCEECAHVGACRLPGNSSMVCQNLIPTTLPKWIRSVTLECFQGRDRNIPINATTFSGEGWSNIKRLEINHHSGSLLNLNLILEGNAFRPLVELVGLHIHMTGGRFLPGVFNGLDKLETLNVTDSVTMSRSQITRTLTAGVMKNLKSLILTRAGDRTSGISLDTTLANFIGARPITLLDVSYMRVFLINVTAISLNCANLETLLAKGLSASSVYQTADDVVCKNLKVVDFSGVRAPHASACAGETHSLQNEENFEFNIDGFKTYAHAETIIARDYCLSVFNIRNVTGFRFQTAVVWNLRQLYYDRNFLEYADIEILCDNPTIEILSIRENQMRFISPKFFTCVHTLKTLDLTTNQLYKMQERNQSAFANMLMFLPNLEEIRLSDNSLGDLPTAMFAHNGYLRVIDVSINKMEQIHFLARVTEELTLLNLSGNQISVLDDASLEALISQTAARVRNNKKIESVPWLDVRRNPFSCSACEHHRFVAWFVSNLDAVIAPEQLRCVDDKGQGHTITQSVADHLEYLCRKPAESRSITEVLSAIGAVLAVLVALLFLGRKFSNRCMKDIQMREKKRALREGNGQYEFFVFLAFNERDDDFIDAHVINDLQDNLRTVVGTPRNLVCKGDFNFRPGFQIDDNIVDCLERCSLLLFVLSENSLTSVYCRREYDHAIEMGKPVVFMVKDRINEGDLSPSMLQVYQNRARVFWVRENGNYVLRPSWRIVCTTLLELLIEK